MGPGDADSETLEFDLAFDSTFDHLVTSRITYEDDPRDPQRIAALGAARAQLEDARTAMNSERERLGLQPRRDAAAFPTRIEGQPVAGWQSTRPD